MTTATEEQLVEKINNLLDDNTDFAIRIESLTEELADKDLEIRDLNNKLTEEKEMNIVVRDSVVKFTNQNDVSGLIQVCQEYISHYYKPDALTFYINDDSVLNTEFSQMAFAQVYSYHVNEGHISTPESIIKPMFYQIVQSQVAHKELSSLDLSKLSSRNVNNGLICKLQYSNRLIGFILLEYYTLKKTRTNNLMYLLLEMFGSSYYNLLITNLLATQYDHVLTQAYVDTKTGVGNSRALNRDIEGLYEAGKSYWLLGMDIDNFKRVNDSYGHDIGDEVIHKVANVIDFHMKRLGGQGYREGGDEFLGICFGTEEEVRSIVGELFLEISTYVFTTTKSENFTITNSGGLYHSDKNEHTETVKKKADILLYRSKENGKKQFTIDQTVTI